MLLHRISFAPALLLLLLGGCQAPDPSLHQQGSLFASPGSPGAESDGGAGVVSAACAPACGEGERCSGAGECACGDLVGLPGGGPVCGTGEVCASGVCRTPGTSCASDADCGGLSCCDGECVDTDTDVGHCGGCGLTCDLPGGTEQCLAGSCEVARCLLSRFGHPLFFDCDASPGCETPRSAAACGACGVACDPGERCSGAGECVCGSLRGAPGGGAACGEGERCSGAGECACGDLVGLPGAGPVCDAEEVCESGACRTPGASCASDADCGGLSCCDGECVDTDTDVGHCGGCGLACELPNATEQCLAGSCEVAQCLLSRFGHPLFFDCDASPGCETPRSASACGACGVACGLGERCNGSGQCVCGALEGAPGGGPVCPTGEQCDGSGCTAGAVCGNGVIESGEVCDDGNRIDGDGCSSSCAVERMISSGGEATCAVLETGAVRCWGYNAYGQLGLGPSGSVGADIDLGGPALQVATSGYHACALLVTGAVRCWGSNWSGDLGYGHTSPIGDDETPASAGDIDLGGTAVQIAVGVEHSCALLVTGAVRCWGSGRSGRLGYGNTLNIGDDETPASAGDIDLGGAAVQIAAGGAHTCALLDTGAVRCWGSGRSGKLGYGNTLDIGDDETPASAGDIDLGGTAVQISAGGSITCALLDTGAARCWGSNSSGELGYGNTLDIGDDETPASAGDIDLGGAAIRISAGGNSSCAMMLGGGLRCWGSNSYGALGYAHTNPIGDDETPASAGDVDLGGTAVQISTGFAEPISCAILDTGAGRCWGGNWEGQLGYGHTNPIGDNETPASAGDILYL